jgi:hypothetical protein
MTGAIMARADFLPVKTIIPQVLSFVHRRMEQAPYPFLLPVQKSQEFAVVDRLQKLWIGRNLFSGIGTLKILWVPAQGKEKGPPLFQQRGQNRPGVIFPVIEAAAGPAGFGGIRLAERGADCELSIANCVLSKEGIWVGHQP